MHPEDRPGITERLASAMVSNDLAWSPLTVRDVDYVAAIGTIGVKHRLATNLWRLFSTLDPTVLPDVLREAEIEVMRLSARAGWNYNWRQCRKAARKTLEWLVFPVCRRCHGQKYTVVPGTHRLGKQTCAHCHGSGLEPIKGDRLRTREIATIIERKLDNLEPMVRERMRRKDGTNLTSSPA